MARNILIVSGEPSGDLHASNIVKELKKIKGDIEFFGIGGSLSKEAGVEIDFDVSNLAIVGLVDAWKNIFTIGRIFKDLLKKIDSKETVLAILVDYPGFNLRLAGQLKRRGIRVIYYISPQVWAWGMDRINIIKRCIEKMLVFFKFEEELYKRHGVNVEFIGHPLVETVRPSISRDETIKKYSLSTSDPVIALLPGSRAMEVKTLLKIMVKAAVLMKKELRSAQFVIAKYRNLPSELYETAVKDSGLDIKIVDGDAYNILNASDFAIVASGTATLETAILGRPFVIAYRASFINYIAFKIVARTRVLGLVNIIAGRTIVPELLQYDATGQKIAKTSLEIIQSEQKRSVMLAELKKVRDSLGSPGASSRAAGAVLAYLE